MLKKNKVIGTMFRYYFFKNILFILFLSFIILIALASFVVFSSYVHNFYANIKNPILSQWVVYWRKWIVNINAPIIIETKILSFGTIMYYTFSILFFTILSISSIYFTSALFVSEFKGRMVSWLFSGISKKNLWYLKLAIILLINFIIIFPAIIAIIALSLAGTYDSDGIKRMTIMIFEELLFTFAITSFYYLLGIVFVNYPLVFYIISVLFLVFTFTFSVCYLVSNTYMVSSPNKEEYKGTTIEKLWKLRYFSFTYLLQNFFDYKHLSHKYDDKINYFIFYKDKGLWGSNLFFKNELISPKWYILFVKNLALLFASGSPFVYGHVFAEKYSYRF